jgi:hypothetical protein
VSENWITLPPVASEASARLMEYLEARGWYATRRDKDRGIRWFTPPHEDGEVEVGPEVAPDVAARIAELEGRPVEDVEADMREAGVLGREEGAEG